MQLPDYGEEFGLATEPLKNLPEAITAYGVKRLGKVDDGCVHPNVLPTMLFLCPCLTSNTMPVVLLFALERH